MVKANAGAPAITAESAYEREQAEAFGYEAANGKVVAEFTCNKIGTVYPLCMIPKWATVDACLTREDIYKYLGTEHGYGMQIDDLKIYDTPRELDGSDGHAKMTGGVRAALCTVSITGPAAMVVCRFDARRRAGAMWRKSYGTIDLFQRRILAGKFQRSAVPGGFC